MENSLSHRLIGLRRLWLVYKIATIFRSDKIVVEDRYVEHLLNSVGSSNRLFPALFQNRLASGECGAKLQLNATFCKGSSTLLRRNGLFGT